VATTSEAKIKLTAEDVTGGAFTAVLKNVNNLKTELTGLPGKFTQIAIASAGIGSIAGFAEMIAGTIEAKAKLRDLSIETNISVEALSGLARVGKLANTPIEDIAAASVKLSKNLFTTTESSKGAGAAVKALGLDMGQLRTLSPDQQLYEVAKALDGFQDGAGKSAVAALLLGKSGAQLLPFLREYAELGPQAAKVSKEQAEQAYQFEQNLRRLKAAGDEWKAQLGNEMLPTLLNFTRELVAAREAYGGWFSAIIGGAFFHAGPMNVEEVAAGLKAAQADVAKLEGTLASAGSGAPYLIGADANDAQQRADASSVVESQLATARKKLAYFKRLQGFIDKDTAGAAPPQDKPALTPPAEDDALTKIFQGRLKLIKEQLERERDGFEFANKFLKGVYDDGVTSLSDFYQKQQALREANLQSELHAVSAEIAAAQELKAKAIKPEARQEAENKIAEAVEHRKRVIQKASQEEILAAQDEAKAVKQLGFAYYDFLANVATLKGDAGGASALRIVKQVQDAQELLTKVGFSPDEAQARAGAFRLLLEQTEKLSLAQADYNRLTDSLGISEKNLALDAQANGSSELDTLRAIGAERQKQLPLMQALVDRALKEAEAIGSPDALLAAQKLQLAFKQAVAEADPLFLRLRDIGKEFGDAIGNDAEVAILHWEGFRKLLNSIESDILRIATRKLFTEPFSNYLTNAIGGNGQSGGGGGLLGSGFLGNLFNPGASAGGGGFGTGSQFGNMDFGGFFADGGTLQPGQWGIAGENGPEPIYAGATPLHVTPAGGASPSIHLVQNFAAGTDHRTVNQAAAAAGDAITRALRRNR
jgi:hypothetical protein